MRVGIYNNFWSTMGGGEMSALSYASYFARGNTVELISSNDIPLKGLAETFNRPEVMNYKTKIISSSNSASTECSQDYDLFICHSYLSETYSIAKKSIYVCMFPHCFSRDTSKKIKVFSNRRSDEIHQEQFADRVILNSNDRLKLVVHANREVLTFITKGAVGKILISATKGGVIFESTTTDEGKFHRISLLKGSYFLTFFGDESKSSVLLLDSLRIGNGLEPASQEVSRSKRLGVEKKSFLDSYDVVLANSEYTSSFISERWGITSRVHYPAVNIRRASSFHKKEKVILSIGRFFDGAHGHSKRQLELVEAFRRLYQDGYSDWRLVLIGGCDRDNRDYALEVKRRADGMPIDVLLNADNITLDQYLAKAMIYWHATGLNVDLDKSPDKAEHFGIAPVEAMSSGCIPVLYGIGGTSELVEDGHSGFLFFSEDELVDITKEILNLSESARVILAENAIERASRFSEIEFEKKLESFVHEIL